MCQANGYVTRPSLDEAPGLDKSLVRRVKYLCSGWRENASGNEHSPVGQKSVTMISAPVCHRFRREAPRSEIRIVDLTRRCARFDHTSATRDKNRPIEQKRGIMTLAAHVEAARAGKGFRD